MEKIIWAFFVIIFIDAVSVSCSKKENEDEINPFNGQTTALFNPNIDYGSLTDQDGNIYKTVRIGNQTWMAENLRTTKYNDGTPIQNVSNDDDWSHLSTGAYCNYNNLSNVETIATYGRLYNGYAVITGKLAPKGWHVATDADWTTLVAYLECEGHEANKLKETGATHWETAAWITDVTNETGFTAIPSGTRGPMVSFAEINLVVYWWCVEKENSGNLWYLNMIYYSENIFSGNNLSQNFGFSIRCVMD
jgi:uncharacterized protein (TIGR02145 family)